ncbi:MAG TPA: hypothetical protein PLO67_14715 [Saprospiraceae bacterium]|nr:hypothetical protein [Saprospiraceae bacterium]
MRLIFFLASFIPLQTLHAQRFYENQMLYPDEALKHLKADADSLQKRWQTGITGTNPEYFPYAIVQYFSLDTLAEQAYRDIQNGINWRAFVKKHPYMEVVKNTVVVFPKVENYREGETLPLPAASNLCRCPEVDSTANVFTLEGKILTNTYRKDSLENNGHLNGLYLKQVYPAQKIPEPYASWVRYADFIIGPEPLFLNKYESMYQMYRKDSLPRPAHDRFFEYIDIPRPPQPTDWSGINTKYMDFTKDRFRRATPYRIWQEKRALHIQETLEKKEEFKQLLEAAVDETIRLGIPDELLEDWALQYLDEEKGWVMMRLRPVYSSCGNDPAPTKRMYEIAQYCARYNAHWHSFIQAHLGLVMDGTDWSIDSRTRFTRELETLGLDVPALLLGSVIKTTATSEMHGRYRGGSISRVGWALAQCRDADQIARQLLDAMADERLDMQNRLILYRVYKQMRIRKYALQFGFREYGLTEKHAEKDMKRAQRKFPKTWRTSLQHVSDW